MNHAARRRAVTLPTTGISRLIALTRLIALARLTGLPRFTDLARLTRIAPFAAMAALVGLAGCAAGTPAPHAAKGQIVAVGAENQYANVISQVGGRWVSVTAVESNPNTDPHSFEASPSIAEDVAAARLVVQNGVGYDTFMNRIESAAPSSSRKVIDVQALLGLPDSTPNPHLWYEPTTMPAVAAALVRDLSALEPAHAAYFAANARAFDASLEPWDRALAQFAARYPGTPVATTEPVGDYMLAAAGTVDLTPSGFQADIMNGVDPPPQDVTLEDGLFARHLVKVFVYNEQVTDSLTQSFLADARRAGVPVVGVYETMPTPGYDYQSWMLAEVRALERAVADDVSTERLT
jgi:zinc/manganese transport system substrate-binding protein